ncbi:MAG: hypothetical protein F4160_14550 [Rhodospirillaceae bacterium]|nr:hypothetical protein [Rhodospirillaceae bacterium]
MGAGAVPFVLPAPAPFAPANDPVAAATTAQVERAVRRLAAVDRAEALAAQGMFRPAADAAAGAEIGVSGRTVALWRKSIRGVAPEGNRIAALLDAARSGRPRKRGREGWDGEGKAVLWDLWKTDYLREEAPPAAAVYRRLAAIAAHRGFTLPTIDAFKRRTRREIPRAVIVRAREGRLAVKDLVPAQERTVAGMKPLDIVNGDGWRADVMVRFPNGKEDRPVLWVFQDVRTRRILAWKIGETENAGLVRASLHDVIMRYGLPRKLLVDNTRAVSAKSLTGGQRNRRRWRSTDQELPGLLQRLDIEYGSTAVDTDAAGRGKGRGRSKPVERAFMDLSNSISSHPLLAGAGTGRSPKDRPETHRMRAAPLAVFEEVVAEAVAEYNARPGRRMEAAAGRSINECWEAEIAETTVRKITAGQAAILLLDAEECKVKGNGVITLRAGRATHHSPNRYWNAALNERAGERVAVHFDPDNLHGSVYVYDREGGFVCEAKCVAKEGFDNREAARKHERARRKELRSAEKNLEAARDVGALEDALYDLPPSETPPEPEPAAVQLVRNKEARIPAPAADPARSAPAKPAAPNGRFTEKMERFCQHYADEPNAFKAAVAAGYPERTARQAGCRLAKHPAVRERLKALQEEAAERVFPKTDTKALKRYLRARAQDDDAPLWLMEQYGT